MASLAIHLSLIFDFFLIILISSVFGPQLLTSVVLLCNFECSLSLVTGFLCFVDKMAFICQLAAAISQIIFLLMKNQRPTADRPITVSVSSRLSHRLWALFFWPIPVYEQLGCPKHCSFWRY